MISIIDDDRSVREAVKSLIRSLGYEAVTFASAEEYLGADGAYDFRMHHYRCPDARDDRNGSSGSTYRRWLS